MQNCVASLCGDSSILCKN